MSDKSANPVAIITGGSRGVGAGRACTHTRAHTHTHKIGRAHV